MICLTKLIKEIHGNLCETLILNIDQYLKYCDSMFQFPLVPVHLGHIHFLYENITLKSNSSLLIIPDYICYNKQLCDCIIPSYFYKNFSCLYSNEFDLIESITGNVWIDMILSIDSYFRCCLTFDEYLNNKIQYENSSSLYQCQNSSKFISKHRIMDENIDCRMKDDEDYQISCLIKDKYRIKCFDKCLSSLHTENDCSINEKNFDKNILFKHLCDGLGEISFQDSNNEIYTDESQCNYWPCNNIYTRCDGFWTCLDGKDEENCYKTICPLETYPCISPLNYSFICLSSEKINDGRNDCLGSMDEMEFCRRVYPSEKDPKRFRCQNSDLCLSSFELCNHIQSCPHGDDELFCQQNSTFSKDILWNLIEIEKNKIVHFSIYTSSNYPQLETNIQWKSHEEHPIQKLSNSQKSFYSLPSHCNRGLTVRLRWKSKYVCMCPPSYYGNLCQYQNERVSLTLGLVRAERRDVYIIIILLIDNDNNQYQQINSYDQFQYVPSQTCGIKLNRYLLYSTRPKNISKNYSINIHIYEKHTMIYRGSWYLSIPFLFLPVNRLSALLFIPSEQNSILLNCPIICQNGQCIKYINIPMDQRFLLTYVQLPDPVEYLEIPLLIQLLKLFHFVLAKIERILVTLIDADTDQQEIQIKVFYMIPHHVQHRNLSYGEEQRE